MQACNELPILISLQQKTFQKCQQPRVFPDFDPVNSGELQTIQHRILYRFLKSANEFQSHYINGIDMDKVPAFVERFYLNADAAISYVHPELAKPSYETRQVQFMRNAYRLRADPKKVATLHQNKFGELSEGPALKLFKDSHHCPLGYELARINVAVLDSFPILSCSPDALLINTKDSHCNCVEVKMREGHSWTRWRRRYDLQAQLQMATTKLKEHITILFNPSLDKIRTFTTYYNHHFARRELNLIRTFFFPSILPTHC